METKYLKSYAPKARRDFAQAVINRAANLGIYQDKTAAIDFDGSSAVIEGRIFSKKEGQQRNSLVKRVEELGTTDGKLNYSQGFEQFINEIAFTWFNRLTAIRYMEVNEYLSHGFRVLSKPPKQEGDTKITAKFGEGFEILASAADVAEDLDLNKDDIVDMLLAGNQEEALYREILLGQCHQLSKSMPFMFEKLDDATELLLPDNLTKTDSILKDLINDVPEDNWRNDETGKGNIEVIGWLYQFYISEHKDIVMGKVVKAEDIPAATQLFTPNWIVKYLVQNSLGHKWLQSYPESELKDQMEYYTTPAEQAEDVVAQLKAITPDTINPEEIKIIDAACGSGHILVEVYELLREIYIECGYRPREIPELILTKNIYGLDIDDRAAQMAAFAVIMKAREDDKRILDRIESNDLHLNIYAMQSTESFNINDIWQALNIDSSTSANSVADLFSPEQVFDPVNAGESGELYVLIEILIKAFVKAKTLGSLIDVSSVFNDSVTELSDAITRKKIKRSKLASQLSKASKNKEPTLDLENQILDLDEAIFSETQALNLLINVQKNHLVLLAILQNALEEKKHDSDPSARHAVAKFLPIIYQAQVLTTSYEISIMNPPYMGSKGMNKDIKDFGKYFYPNSKSDLFAMFMERIFGLLNENGYNAQVNMQSWMFLSSFQKMRESLLDFTTFITMAHLGARAFGQISGEVVQTTAWVLNKKSISDYRPSFFRLISGSEEIKKNDLLNKKNLVNNIEQNQFSKVPGSPIAYWASETTFNTFDKHQQIYDCSLSEGQNITANNDRYLRMHWEVNSQKVESAGKWSFYAKGGTFKKWFGNLEHVVDWSKEAQYDYRKHNSARIIPEYLRFRKGITWTLISSTGQSFRFLPDYATFDKGGSSIFFNSDLDLKKTLMFLNSNVSQHFTKLFNATLNLQVDDVRKLPFTPNDFHIDEELYNQILDISELDWNTFETSWNFKKSPLITNTSQLIEESLLYHFEFWEEKTNLLKYYEERNNKNFIDIYQLNNELDMSVPKEKITLSNNASYRFGSISEGNAQQESNKSRTLSEFLSYAIGCMMGRYSIDCEGLIYAHSGNDNFDSQVNEDVYKTFPADDDGIVPLASEDWLFDDDATVRFREFVKTVWGDASLHGGRNALNENIDFVAECLCLDAIKPLKGKEANETSMDTIRRYFSTQFYKDHLRTYNKRPIYWLFSSGKEKAFECLVYLHRYNEGTLSRMRTEYVTPLMGKLESRKAMLNEQHESATAAEQRAIDKELKSIDKKQAELRTFDEELKHFSEMKISLDLDDGVKVNYGKFGNLLADVKGIHGQTPEVVK
jgi:type II restriction/modification system DNA methylase subunit YeeA